MTNRFLSSAEYDFREALGTIYDYNGRDVGPDTVCPSLAPNGSAILSSCGEGRLTVCQTVCESGLPFSTSLGPFKNCIIPGNGGWSDWWEDPCTHTCGNGTKILSRSYTNPPAMGTGLPCAGPARRTETCFTECPGENQIFCGHIKPNFSNENQSF